MRVVATGVAKVGATSGDGAVRVEGDGLAIGGARYEVVRPLGRGGMAEVWLARLVVGSASWEVALKCGQAELLEDERVRRELAAEAELGRQLIHPNIGRTYGGELAGDRYYLVLEYVDGLSVGEVLVAAGRQGKVLSEGFSCHVVASVAEALEYAHGRTGDGGRPLAIVHRDVKATNIMVAASGVVKLLDFGVAYSLLEGRDRTETGKLKGTCGYCSPEQARGRGEPIDRRSDLFSLGIVLTEMLTGKRPFEGESDYVTLGKIGDCDAGEVEAATRGLPAGLREVCRRALAREPALRFQTGGELARMLREYLVQRGAVYGPSECASELAELRSGLAGGVGEAAEAEGTVAGAWAGSSMWPAKTGSAPPTSGPTKRRLRLLLLGLVLAGCGLGLAGSALIRGRWGGGRDPVAIAMRTGGGSAQGAEAGARCEASSASSAAVGEMASAPVPPEGLVVARPKGPRKGAKRGVSGRAAPAAKRAAEEQGGDGGGPGRGEEGKGVVVLSRGTLIGARLLRPIDPSVPGIVEASVREDVEEGGAVRVARGSGIVCRSGRGRESRVEVSCGEIRAGERRLGFTGIAVQGGQVGLRVIDGEVPAGATFSVYVSAASRW